MKIKRPLVSIALALLALSTLNYQLSTALAQGTAFTYQGRLNNGANPANGLYDFEFSLSNAPSGGSQVGSTVTKTAIGVTNGLFLTTLDFGAVFTGNPAWLAISVRTNGVGSYAGLIPLQDLTPTPYAITAANLTGTVGNGDLSGTYGNQISLDNAADQFTGSFTGSGAGLTNVWQTGGNAGTVPGNNFLGTTDNQPLELHVDGQRALRLEPTASGEPNVIGGAPNNSVASGDVGATIAGGFGNTVSGIDAVSGGGYKNTVNGAEATVAGGGSNGTGAQGATIAGGFQNQASGPGSFIGGGGFDGANFSGNNASGNATVIGGGLGNTAIGSDSFIGGGLDNTNFGDFAAVGGGYFNNAGGNEAAIPGGYGNVANGSYSFAAGYEADADYNNAFVWSDGEYGVYASDRAEQFKVAAGGGVQFDVSGSAGLNPAALRVNSTSANGVGLFVTQNSSDATTVFTAAGTGDIIKGFSGGSGGNLVFEVVNNGTVYSQGFALTSDRNAKEHFAAVSPAEILKKVAALPISRWNYKTDAGVNHVGPVAQDFHAAFGLNGKDDKHISVVDEGGVALAAIQGLNQKLDEKDAEIHDLKVRLEKLEQLMNGKNGEAK